MKNYGQAMKDVREIMKENDIKQFALIMDEDATSYSYDKSMISEDSKFSKVIDALKNN